MHEEKKQHNKRIQYSDFTTSRLKSFRNLPNFFSFMGLFSFRRYFHFRYFGIIVNGSR